MQLKERQGRKQQQYLQKLKLIDQHIAKASTLQTSNNDFQDILKILALKLLSDPPIELVPFTPKTFIFTKLQPKRIFVNQLSASKDKKFVLYVNTHSQVKISISIDEQKGKIYTLNANKVVQISYLSWKKLNIVVQISKIGLLCQVRLHLGEIKSNRGSPRKIGVNLRPKIDNQLEDYLKSARGKTADIIRQRSLARIQQNLARRSASSNLKDSKRSVELIKTKSQLLRFEKQKQLYFKHVEKMSPTKVNQLKEEKLSYENLKAEQIKNFAKLVYTVKLGLHIKSQALKIHLKRFKQIKTQMLSLEFIKILKNKLRLKITEKARLRMNVIHHLKLMPQMIKPGAIKRAKDIIRQSLVPYMEFRGLQEIAQNSQDYLNGLKKIQRFMRKRAEGYPQRIGIICDRLCEKLKIDVSKKSRQAVIKKYLKACIMEKYPKFYRNKDIFIQDLRENAE